jgi:hypothetical protein
MTDDLFPLTRLPGELRRLKLVELPVAYRSVYNAVLDGRIPAEQGTNGRWYWRNSDLPVIALAFRRPIAA